jgi:glycosyltransferase involved in cell wall biosynthesis
MRIGLDAACWSNQRGYGRFTRDLLKVLLETDQENEYFFFSDSDTNAIADFPDGVIRRVLDVKEIPTRAASATGSRSLRDIWKMGRAVAKESLDLFFFPSVYTYFPIMSRTKKIVGILDVIAEKYPGLVFSNNKHRLFWNLKVWAAVKQAHSIITLSEFSKKGILEHFGLKENQVRVVYAAADALFRRIDEPEAIHATISRLGLDSSQRFILYVGGIAPHKNLSVLVNAYSELIEKPHYQDVTLVLVGDYEKDVFLIDYELKKLINRLKLDNNVIFTGFVPDDELVHLYNAASVFVLPSFCEGFGLPALEAMSCGTPVIGSDTTSLPEVIGDAGLFFNPKSPEELVDKLVYILDDESFRKELGERSVRRASHFSWSKSAAQLLAVFNEFG